MNRTPDAGGKGYWVNKLTSKQSSGAEVASGFIFSDEFKGKNYCNTDFVKQLYRAFMGREYDAGGLKDWVNKLNSGTKREEVFNGFAQSNEFKKICASYGIELGSPMKVPEYGTAPNGACNACGAVDGVTGFVTRLYKVCLGRTPDKTGLDYWCTPLRQHTNTGAATAHGFIFSDEFTGKKYSNADYVEHLYEAFMGRGSDAGGKADWVGQLNAGKSREDVFNGFVGSDEFSNICNSYGITRG